MISCSLTRNNGYEKFILPENFEGSVIVFYDDKESMENEKKMKNILFIKLMKVVFTIQKKNIATGVINHIYFRRLGNYEEKLKRVSFPLLENESINTDSVYVMDLISGEFSKRPIGSNLSSLNYGKVKFISFIIGKYVDREKLINEREKKIDSLQIAYRNR